jgi:hypothetical protein
MTTIFSAIQRHFERSGLIKSQIPRIAANAMLLRRRASVMVVILLPLALAGCAYKQVGGNAYYAKYLDANGCLVHVEPMVPTKGRIVKTTRSRPPTCNTVTTPTSPTAMPTQNWRVVDPSAAFAVYKDRNNNVLLWETLRGTSGRIIPYGIPEDEGGACRTGYVVCTIDGVNYCVRPGQC